MGANMAQNLDQDIPANVWTLITDADVTAVTFQNKGSTHVMLKSTTDTTPPTNFSGSIRYNPGQGILRDVALATIFPGLTGRDRLWVYAYSPVTIFISHA
jgi:hypothetical protein